MNRALSHGRWLSALAWMALIFLLSSQSDLPRPRDPTLDLIAATTVHFSLYAVLAVLLRWSWYFPGGLDRRARLVSLMAFAIAAMYGLSDEVHQAFVPHRDPSVADWLTDAAGAAWGLWVLAAVGPWLAARWRALDDAA